MEAPAEWEPHDAVWLAWPEGEELWDGHLEAVRREWVALCRAIRDVDTAGGAERLFIVTRDAESEAMASDALGPLDAGFAALRETEPKPEHPRAHRCDAAGHLLADPTEADDPHGALRDLPKR